MLTKKNIIKSHFNLADKRKKKYLYFSAQFHSFMYSMTDPLQNYKSRKNDLLFDYGSLCKEKQVVKANI